ncbi:helix-turn-helix domain-containing protein [Herbaspirillum sp. alder98]|uniref:AraC-like ligand-binding domain-containing protein n=1 Tax=Herbaspirillum sp. alder98 TaxID=2913096 RepID=UPI001CD8224D|nr:helix-turn-helix domain-containing protein [Herbaspirillum sp. alder98]MCA1325190.1 helix-turn-helix domain-containing protein [Herbaspirillum sp. alder98]
MPQDSSPSSFATAPLPAPAELHLSTRHLRPHERVDYWREMVCRRFAEVQIASRLGTDFFGEMQAHQYAALRLTSVSAKAQAVTRVGRDARSESEDCYFAVLLLAGSEFIAQDGREARLLAGDMAIYDGARPHRLIFPEDFSKLILQIPRQTLEGRVGRMRHITARVIDGRQGAGALASGFVRSVAGSASQLGLQHHEQLSGQIVDLLALAIDGAVVPESCVVGNRIQSLARVKRFIELHLGDCELDSTMVAAGAGLSPRYVNQLFEEEGTSLMRYVWRRRLERCRAELLAPQALRSYDIALRWGFNDPSHFSRAFRKQFGTTPRALRRQVDG